MILKLDLTFGPQIIFDLQLSIRIGNLMGSSSTTRESLKPPRQYTSPTCPTTRQTDGVVAELRRRDDEILHAAASELKFNFFFFFFRLLHDDWTAAVRIGFPPLFLFLFLYDWIKSGPCRFGTNRLEATSIVLCKSAK